MKTYEEIKEYFAGKTNKELCILSEQIQLPEVPEDSEIRLGVIELFDEFDFVKFMGFGSLLSGELGKRLTKADEIFELQNKIGG